MSALGLPLLANAATATASADDSYIIWGAALFAVAIVMIVVELFIPSGGLIGIVAGIALIGSIVSFFKYDSTWGVIATLTYIVIVPIFIVFMFKYWTNSPLGRKLVLGGDDPGFVDPDGAAASAEIARRERANELRSLIGASGTTVTALRPVGTIKIGDQRVDGIAESGIIESGVKIIVADVYDNQIKVRPDDSADASN